MPARTTSASFAVLLLALLAVGCGAPAAAEAPPEALAPFPTEPPLAVEALRRHGEPMEFVVCGGSPTWTLPSREEQQREVWATMLRGAPERQRVAVESSFTQPFLGPDGPGWLLSERPEEDFQRVIREYGLWNAPDDAWGCRASPLDPATRAVEVLMKGYRVTDVRQRGTQLLLWGEPAPGFEWGRVLLPAELGGLYVHVRLSDGAYDVSQWVPEGP